MGSPLRQQGDGMERSHRSPRLWSLCREVAMCSDQMDSLQQEMGVLRDELRAKHDSTLHDSREFRGSTAEADVIEGELQLAEYRLGQLVDEKSKVQEKSKLSPPHNGIRQARELKSRYGRLSPRRLLDDEQLELQEYLPKHVRGTPSPGKRGNVDGEMPRRLRELSDAIRRRDAEIAALREEVLDAGAAGRSTPSMEELKTLAKENDILANRAFEATERAAALTKANQALERDIEEGQQKTHALNVERKELLKKIGELEKVADLAEEQMHSDLKNALLKSEKQVRELENTNSALERQMKDSELREANALRVLKRTEVNRKAEEESIAEQIERARSSTEQAERRASGLEQSLADVHAKLRSEEELRGQSNRELRAEVAEIRNKAAHAENAERAVQAELNESRLKENETERKAVDVARELFETSQSLAWLREEVAMQRGLRSELGEERQASQILRQKLEALQLDSKMHASGDSSDLGGASAAEMELKELREGQVRAVSEALHCAWEAEARERRNIEQQLEALRARWQPLQRQLVRLCSNATRWYEALRSYGEPQTPLPPPPTGIAWDDENEASEATEKLRAFLEALAEESMKRVADSRSRINDLELLQQELSDRAVTAIMRKKDKVDRLKVEKQNYMQQIHQLKSEPSDFDQISSAPSSPPRPVTPTPKGASIAARPEQHPVFNINSTSLNSMDGAGNVGAISALPVNSSTEQMYEPWDDRGNRLQMMQHQINQLQRESFRPRTDLRSQHSRSTPALRGNANGRSIGSGSRGPLYRVDDAPRRLGSFAPERHKQHFQPGHRGVSAYKKNQIKVHNASYLEPSERFDADSIHFPFPGKGAS